MSSSDDKTPHAPFPARICHCASCLEARGEGRVFSAPRVVGKSPDLASPYDTARYIKDEPGRAHSGSLADYQKQARPVDYSAMVGNRFDSRSVDEAVTHDFYNESGEVSQRVWDDMYDDTASYHRKVEWWRPGQERVSRAPRSLLTGSKDIFVLFACLCASIGVALLLAALIGHR